ncbi:HAMP domain-containing histidine kinase [Rhizobium wenxiniae]|uniref:sensor histidine kinase n=1 Tax=Rhizobium wenxiniae TaxID=1737357 RepID=UPI001C6E7703|nr:HAMP domain-containing sensor histidine kinase [Rhizobium wenxiniae]MBW9088124.1 HAMP domain-containing histidine kinase [Rhizobium wenxiniae]
MKFQMFSRRSLKGRLVLRFSIVLGALMIVMNIGFLVLLAYLLPTKHDADEAVRPVIAAAIRSENGALAVYHTDDLQRLKDAAPLFWFLAVHPDGRQVGLGTLPPQYQALLPIIGDIHFLDIRGEDNSPLTANFSELDTQAGKVKVLYGGTVVSRSYLMKIMLGMSVLYIPFTLIPIGLVFLALPILVGRALSGLKRTISHAASIDANSLGIRLPKEDVVEELQPLVDAFNSALGRIDEDVTQRRRFFANAAHELRTPIAILQTRLEAFGPSGEKERLLMDVQRLAQTAEQLLDMQRFGAIQSWDQIDLVELGQKVVAESAPLAISAGYELGFDAESRAVVINGDRDSLERAVNNLIRNAIEHGGGSGNIRVEISRHGWIDVVDDGPGVPREERDKVFEPFYRSKPKSTGAGLGLSIVRQIAQLHNGQVGIISQRFGARFRLILKQ